MRFRSLFSEFESGGQGSTAQRITTQGIRSTERQKLLPWIIGGVVFVVALIVIHKL